MEIFPGRYQIGPENFLFIWQKPDPDIHIALRGSSEIKFCFWVVSIQHHVYNFTAGPLVSEFEDIFVLR